MPAVGLIRLPADWRAGFFGEKRYESKRSCESCGIFLLAAIVFILLQFHGCSRSPHRRWSEQQGKTMDGFLEFILSERGREITEKEGFVPPPLEKAPAK